MSRQKPPYAIVARIPACNCIVMSSYYNPAAPASELREIAKEVAACIKEGLLITTMPFDQNPLSNGESFGCSHPKPAAAGQLPLRLPSPPTPTRLEGY